MYASLWNCVANAKDDITDSDSAAIVADKFMWSLKMTYAPTSAPEGIEQDVPLEKGMVESETHEVVMGRR